MCYLLLNFLHLDFGYVFVSKNGLLKEQSIEKEKNSQRTSIEIIIEQKNEYRMIRKNLTKKNSNIPLIRFLKNLIHLFSGHWK